MAAAHVFARYRLVGGSPVVRPLSLERAQSHRSFRYRLKLLFFAVAAFAEPCAAVPVFVALLDALSFLNTDSVFCVSARFFVCSRCSTDL